MSKMAKFNIYKFLETRPLSYSALNSFADPQWGDPEKWYNSYILGIRQSSPELTFGSEIDKRFQEDPTFLPMIPRLKIMQHKMEAQLPLGKHKIPLIGIADQWGDYTVRDLKTGRNAWTKKKADTTEQLTFYALLLWLTEDIKPENVDFYIDWVPTYKEKDGSIAFVEPVVPQTFKTKRTMVDVIKLIQKIEKVIKDMESYTLAINKKSSRLKGRGRVKN